MTNKVDFYTESFEEAWLAYPRRVGKLAAAKAWAKLSEDERKAALDDIAKRTRQHWWSSDPKKIPHFSTYLNGQRWLDEWQEDFKTRYEAEATAPRATFEHNPGPNLDRWSRAANRITLLWLRMGAVQVIQDLIDIKNEAVSEMSSALDEEVAMGNGREAAFLLAETILGRLDSHFGVSRRESVMDRLQ